MLTEFIFSITTQSITFLPLALAISISYTLLRATDMTLDGSFVLGAAAFAKCVSLGILPCFAICIAVIAGFSAGVMVSLIQRGGKVDALLAGILAAFILTSGNLLVMGRPNISLLDQTTVFSTLFARSETLGWFAVSLVSLSVCGAIVVLLNTRFGLTLRALGDNPLLLKRLGNPIERYRTYGFALTNSLAAISGCLTAQTVGYADIGMGLGMTLTGIGAIILGQQIIKTVLHTPHMRISTEFVACLVGVVIYFFMINLLMKFNINPMYLKLILGLTLILFLRTAVRPGEQAS